MKHKTMVDQTLIRRLRAAGCPMPGNSGDERTPGLAIVVGRPEITKACVLPNCVEYVFAVTVSNDSYGPLEMQKFECHLPGRPRLIWPPDPRIQTREKQAYRMPGSGREFPCEIVLNHRTGPSGLLNPGDTLKGILLALRMGRVVPDDYLTSPVTTAELSIVDQHGREHFSEIKVTVDRTAIINSLKLTGRHGRGLYDTSESQAIPAVRDQARHSVEAVISLDIPDERVHSNPQLRSRITILE